MCKKKICKENYKWGLFKAKIMGKKSKKQKNKKKSI